MVFKLIVLFSLLLSHVSFISGGLHQVCDDASPHDSLEAIVENHVTRLMSLRHNDWGWQNSPEVILAFQLSNQHALFEKDLAIQAMEREFEEEENRISLGKLAMYAMAVKSICKDPRDFAGIDLIHRIKRKLSNSIHQHDASANWYSVALAVQALCVNDVPISRSELGRILHGQQQNGSFRYFSAVGTTAQMLIALECVREKQTFASSHSTKKLKGAIKHATKYLKKSVEYFLDSVWIGNKYSTPIASSALKAVNKSFTPRKDCKIRLSMTSCDPTDESEAPVAQRLMALHNATVLSLINNWTCVTETDETPDGYAPSFNASVESSFVCSDAEQADISVFDSLFAIPIDVQLTVFNGFKNSTVTVRDVTKGTSLLHVMEMARCENNFEFQVKTSSWGPFVVSINRRHAEPSLNQYWSLTDAGTGHPLSTGVQQYLPSHEENVFFNLTSF